MRIVFQVQHVCKRKRRTQFLIKLPVFMKKKMFIFVWQFCVSLTAGNTFFKIKWGKKLQSFHGIMTCSRPQTVIGTIRICLPTPRSSRVLSNLQYFPNHWSMEILFASGIGPDILINVVEDCIIFLIWVTWVLFNFCL